MRPINAIPFFLYIHNVRDNDNNDDNNISYSLKCMTLDFFIRGPNILLEKKRKKNVAELMERKKLLVNNNIENENIISREKTP